MKIIADSGSSKTKWIGIDENGQELFQKTTQGLNPYFVEEKEIKNLLQKELGELQSAITSIHFYGAGLGLEQMKLKMEEILKEFLPKAETIEVESDLYAAVRSLFYKGEGIACILGTGANACYCKDANVLEKVPSLGYILADWASGAVLGKQLIASLLKGELNAEMTADFYSTYNLDTAQILDKIYRQANPNRFLASFTTFLYKHKDDAVCKRIIRENFEKFFDDYVKVLLEHKGSETSIGFVGSIAFHFKDFITEEITKRGYKLYKIEKDPLDGLKAYHLKQG
ncbi:N-acetylglucosamine kinase [Sediminitomix flava]|uniref:N-acetylglucosamine kinase-like BadF-type ATPase n=1 Tax=Sediminitomix flava TaxID=379075 RepID=A0A315ZW69_SEDFL|nr:N-acetylglucosamine kinase [Sediminitomix flava]PWJ40923.1 N-acetylglucosamine kinase-like BadF-type ATPase [Sediminitomix flava]